MAVIDLPIVEDTDMSVTKYEVLPSFESYISVLIVLEFDYHSVGFMAIIKVFHFWEDCTQFLGNLHFRDFFI